MRPAIAQVALLASVCALASFAGCLDDEEGLPPLPTAREAEQMARRQAEFIDAGAPLREAYSLEAGSALRGLSTDVAPPHANEVGIQDQQFFARVLATDIDDAPGDGRAPLWILTFNTAERGYRAIVTRYGVAVETESAGPFEAESGSYADDVAGWAIDSDEAAARARQDDAAFAAAVGSPDALVYTVLRQDGGRPTWLLGAHAGLEPITAPSFTAVDASTGNAIPLGEAADVFGAIVRREAGDLGGLLYGGVLASWYDQFEVQQPGHFDLALSFTIRPPPAVAMEILVTAPDGTETTGQLDPGTGTASGAVLRLQDVQVGRYVLEVQATIAPAHDLVASWCTDGVAPSTSDLAACAELPAETLSSSVRWASP